MIKENKVYSLDRDIIHLEEDSFDAWIDEYAGDNFEGWEDMDIAFEAINSVKLPGTITMHAIFDGLELTDFPVCEPTWPIMSIKMIKILNQIGCFKHNVYPITMINSDINATKTNMENNNYAILHLLEHLNIIDLNNSEYEMSTINPSDISSIDKLVLNEPQNGFPPIFRLGKYESELFVSNKARIALEKEKIKGLKFTPLDHYYGV